MCGERRPRLNPPVRSMCRLINTSATCPMRQNNHKKMRSRVSSLARGGATNHTMLTTGCIPSIPLQHDK